LPDRAARFVLMRAIRELAITGDFQNALESPRLGTGSEHWYQFPHARRIDEERT